MKKKNNTVNPYDALIIRDETMRYDANDSIVNSICELIYATKRFGINSRKKLLNQNIRFYKHSLASWHNSVEAISLWNDVTDDSIDDFCYDSGFRIKKDCEVRSFKSTNRTTEILMPLRTGKLVRFNDVFISEHTIPVDDIIAALIKVYSLSVSREENKKRIISILEKMHVTRMRKTEDRELAPHTTRHRVSVDDIINLSSEELFAKAAKVAGYPPLA